MGLQQSRLNPEASSVELETMNEYTPFRWASLALLLFSGALAAQTPNLESCKPVSERTGPEGCWILASKPLGKLPNQPVFWTLDVFPDRNSAQAAAKSGSTVLDALGRVWLLTVGEKSAMPTGGLRITQVGPLPIKADEDYTAQYRESIMIPGAVSRTHVHSGPEAFYTEAGETCLETTSGKQVGRNGHDVIVPEGEPMELVATGAETRRGLVLVLHSSAKPHTTVVTDWHSSGLCRAAK